MSRLPVVTEDVLSAFLEGREANIESGEGNFTPWMDIIKKENPFVEVHLSCLSTTLQESGWSDGSRIRVLIECMSVYMLLHLQALERPQIH